MGETAFYPFLSGRDNLRAAARRCQVPDTRVEAVLESAGLTARTGDRVSGYSLGMKQRLAVAVALVTGQGQPDHGRPPAMHEVAELLVQLRFHRSPLQPSRPPATGRWLHRGAESGLRAAGSP